MRSAVRSTWALGTDYKISYFSFLHFSEVLLVSEYNFEEGGFIDWFPFVYLGDAEEEGGDEVVEHAIVELLQVARGETTVNRHDKIIITEGEEREDM